MEGPPLGPGGEDITWPDQVAPRGRKASGTRKIKPQTSLGKALQDCLRALGTGQGADPPAAPVKPVRTCGHLGVTWGVYLCAGKPPLADIILSCPPELTRCDSVIGLAIPATSGHIQYRGAASGDLYIRISGINRVLLS